MNLESLLTEEAKKLCESVGGSWHELSAEKQLALKALIFTSNGNQDLETEETE